ncbi:MAG TPA: mycothiol synthase [Acidimicrobiales bacterium]|jgi:mycothiol synthase
MLPFVLHVDQRAEAVPTDAVAALLERTAADDGTLALSEGKWLDLVHGGRNGFLAVTATDPAGNLVGYAQATNGAEGWGLEVVSETPGGDRALHTRLLKTSLEELARLGARVHYWVTDPTDESDAALGALGLRADRDLLQMRVDLPLPPTVRTGPPIEVRAYRPGADDAAWLATNNRAFADHPEQGNWDLATLRERQSEPWFDPEGFLVHEIDGELAGSCWTKIHRDTTPPMGEIYVISVDPAFHGRGLGRALTVAGLSWLAGAGLKVGMLFTTASNVPAVELYHSLGFVDYRVQRVYVGDLGPGAPTPALS